MKVLFVLAEPGYFRLYGSTIVELGRRGCDVRLAFDRPDKRGESALVPEGSPANVQSLGAVPGNAPAVATTLRLALDYVRYLEPAFAQAAYLRRRAEKNLPGLFAFLTRVPRLPRRVVSLAIALERALERAIPVNRDMLEFVRRVAPDVIVVTPVVLMGESGARQTEVVKAARAAGIPVVVGVASWDHLTSKGLVRIVPDALTVWNDAQAREALELHRIPSGRIIVTGAQSLDHWFVPPDRRAMAAFRDALGIKPGRCVLLFVGSSRNMAPEESEPRFVRRWLAALRASSSDDLRRAFVIVRPHPSNTEPWREVDLCDPAAAVVPTDYSGIPLTGDEVETFRQSLLVSDAVIGINTTAMIEAAILERPVLTVRDDEFAHSQRETLHVAHLVGDGRGCVIVGGSLAAHVRQLEDVMSNPAAHVDALRAFVGRFVRPRGVGERATKHLCDAIEQVALGAPAAAALVQPALET